MGYLKLYYYCGLILWLICRPNTSVKSTKVHFICRTISHQYLNVRYVMLARETHDDASILQFMIILDYTLSDEVRIQT